MTHTAQARQAGAALLAAMLTVSLVATFAAAALWQQWRGIEVEQAERSRVQAAWILVGALDWARLLLREDRRSAGGGTDHLAEPWAVPLQEARLSTFLSADKGAAVDPGTDAPDAFLSGQIIDLQSLLNVTNLLTESAPGAPVKVSEPDVTSFSRLFELLGLPPAQLEQLVEGLRRAADTSQPDLLAPLLPQRVENLAWLGLPVQTVAVLQPHITILPRRTPVNLNTASAEVIYAVVDGLSLADAQRLVTERDRAHFKTWEDASRVLPGHEEALRVPARVGVASDLFEARARLRLDQLTVEEHSVIDRRPDVVKVVARERGIADPRALFLAARRR